MAISLQYLNIQNVSCVMNHCERSRANRNAD